MHSNLDSTFKEELKKLNPNQRDAVDHIDGPVLVIAGPGTGKTQIISARIGNILSSTDTQVGPHNILCLTYTDAATIAMRQRLEDFIGATAYRVHIYTFHSFCNMVIQENLDYFGKRELEPISELEQVLLCQQLIVSFPKEHPLIRYTGNIYYEVNRLLDLFKKMKEESWTAKYLETCIDSYLKELPMRDEYIYQRNSKEYKKGDLKTAKIEEETKRMKQLKAASNECDIFQNLMKKSSRYDYSDMIQWVIRAFKENQNLLLRYQEQYQYILVDEYQDTNGSQNEMLKLLANFWEVPNVFVVGDDDQSIYRFQGANVKNLMDFHDEYKTHLKKIVLKENYRSSQNILNTSQQLISYNNERLINKIPNLTKQLAAYNDEFAASEIIPVINEYYNTTHEEASLIKEIEQLQENKVSLNDIAVIYRKHKQVDSIIKVLSINEIPINLKRKLNILELPFINKLIKILKYLQLECERPHSAEYLLFEIMHFDFFDISPRDIAVISKACRFNPNTKTKHTWRELISSKEKLFRLNLESIKGISILEANLNYWISNVYNITFQHLFEKIISRGGLLNYIMKSKDQTMLMEALITLFDFIKSESSRQKKFNIKDFLELIELMEQHNISIEIDQVIYSNEGVNFLTAHSSKGLEFKHVYMIGCDSKTWESKGPTRGYKLPDTINASPANDEASDSNLEESRRLFYVGMTRAKEHLNISYSSETNGGKSIEKTQFISEILDGDCQTQFNHQVHLDRNEIIEYQSHLLTEVNEPLLKLLDHEFIASILEKYTMSVTHLNKYLRCPIAFYFENIVKVPIAKSEYMEFGSAVHYALEQLFSKMKDSGNGTFLGSDEFYGFFKSDMFRRKNSFTKEQFDRRLEYGQAILPDYYSKYINHWDKIIVPEYRTKKIEVSGVPLTGAVDKLEFDGNDVNVVDYKTGKPENGLRKLNPPTDKDPNGGDYWRQIVFYKILLDNDRTKKWRMVSGEMDFVEKNAKGEFIKQKLSVTDEDKSIVISQIKDTYQKIMDHQFENGCGDDKCQWCNFVKYNYDAPVDLELVESDEI
ncbi:MAG: ATP-dependent helicase [Bacteroidia bacterium]|nr:ATP-dependent helicase [Bacteroidia bacterium]